MTATIQESTRRESAARPAAKQTTASVPVSGIVETVEGNAFVRTQGYRRGPDDVYVSAAQIRLYGLRKGDLVSGTARPDARGGQYPTPSPSHPPNGMPSALARNSDS